MVQTILYVVDGVIVHGGADVPPEQIESITVLKDTAATSLYGSRGAAGVIVITTKSGKGSSIGININNTYNFFNSGKFKVMNAQQQKERFMEFANNGANLSDILSKVSGGTITNLDRSKMIITGMTHLLRLVRFWILTFLLVKARRALKLIW